MKVKATLNLIADKVDQLETLPIEVWLITQEQLEQLDFLDIEKMQLEHPILTVVTEKNLTFELAPFGDTFLYLITRTNRVRYHFKENEIEYSEDDDVISISKNSLHTKVEIDKYFFIINEILLLKNKVDDFCYSTNMPLHDMYFELDQASLNTVVN